MKSLTSFARFVAFGGGTGVLSSLAVPLLAALMPWALSNALITLASTVLCTELHARYTFRTGGRAGLRRHWQSAGSAAAAYAATSGAVLALHAIVSAPGMLTEQLVYLSASGLAGTGRFVILRVFVFAATGAAHGTATPKTPGTTGTTKAAKAAKAASPISPISPIRATTIARPRRSTAPTPAPAARLTAALSPS
ncbi:hypothetical protein OG440_17780 [Streptomyces sp. NBC_00637]|uniref:hypothetical protein n=1 Tax=Streptomyces sp. NBC_00637 TaxID=2903667 RepID=UPI0032434719